MASSFAPDIALGTPVDELPAVSRRRAGLLKRLGIHNVCDLIRHQPIRYEKQMAECDIAALAASQIGSARGTIMATRCPAGRGHRRFEAILQDEAATLHLVWFNGSYLQQKLHPGMAIRVHGKTTTYNGYPQMVNPRWELLEQDQPLQAARQRLRPIYPATEDLDSRTIEHLVAWTLPRVSAQIIDPVPAGLIRRYRMPALADAHRQAHMPASLQEARAARRRLAYNELLLMQLGIALKRHHNQTRLQAPQLPWNRAIDRHIRERFGFTLTAAQDRVIAQIAADLQRSTPMNRLLQGDVGSGKTVVALYALLMAAACSRQGALMVPTTLLAEQHHMSISHMLEGSNVRIALISADHGAAGSSQRASTLARIENGQVDLVIGTQALLTDQVQFCDLAVVVTDEQHRFGVMQRAQLRNRAAAAENQTARQPAPHNLIMTATPIPRTLSLALFGDVDVSTIDSLPPGRTPITSRVVTQSQSETVYRYVVERIAGGQQAYVVVPAIDESESKSAVQLTSVRQHARHLAESFPSCRVAVIHGQLKRQTRQAIMDRFRRGQIDLLVATTVIEVGLDVPNATLMVVEHADRFGLAQLHQLRGRIGRSDDGRASLCVFVADPTTDEATRRLEAIGSTRDGFKIAEHDLAIRGMGEFFGTRQHGLPPLRVARIPEDLNLLQSARRDAQAIVADDPALRSEPHVQLRNVLMRQYGSALGLVDVG